MRNLLNFILIPLLFSCTTKEETVVRFRVENPTHSKVAIVQDHDSFREAELDKNGNANCTLPGDLLYAHLFYGQDAKLLFLRQDAPLTVSFKGANFSEEVRFEGKTAPLCEYLNEVRLPPLPPDEYARSLDDFLALIQQKTTEATQTLRSKKLEDISPEFAELETARIRYTYAINILMYPMGYIFATGDTTFQPGKEYYDLLNQWMQGDEKLLRLPIYREFVAEAALVLSSPGKRIPDATQRYTAQINYITEHLNNDSVKRAILHELAGRQSRK